MSPLSIDVWIYILTAYLAVSLILYTISRLHCKKRLASFPSPAGMSLTKRSLAGNNLIISTARECLACAIPAEDGIIANIFLQCRKPLYRGQMKGAGKVVFELPNFKGRMDHADLPNSVLYRYCYNHIHGIKIRLMESYAKCSYLKT
jgi:hypothetical protein